MRFACQTRCLLGTFEQNKNSGNWTPLGGRTRFWIFQVTFRGPKRMLGSEWQCAGDLGTLAFESWAGPEKQSVSGLPTGPCALHVHRRLGILGRHRPQALQELTGRIECGDDCSFRTWCWPGLLVSFLGWIVSRTDNGSRSDAVSGSLDVHYGLSHAGSDHPLQGTPWDQRVGIGPGLDPLGHRNDLDGFPYASL